MGMYIHGTAKEEQSRLGKLNQLTNKSFIEYLGNCNDMNICDFGCGLGNLVNEIANTFSNVKVTGIEISKEQYETAVKNNADNDNVELQNTDAFKNNLSEKSFDLVYCRYLLEHVSDPIGLVKEMKRVTKVSGKILAQENDIYNVIYYPTIDGQKEISNAYCNLQIALGGDPYVGRKLFCIFKEAGVQKIELDYKPEIYTEQEPELYRLWMNNALQIFIGVEHQFKKDHFVDMNLFYKVCNEMQRRIDKPDGVALFHWNRVTGYINE